MKQRIREEILGMRREIPHSQRKEYSLSIFQRLIGLDLFKASHNIMAYVAFRNEVETLPVIRHCLLEGKRVLIPVSVPKTRELLLSELKDPERDLRPGTYGVPEPAPEFMRPFPKEDLDLILVPAVAYDEKGFRIGYGAGYYDRFLDGLTRVVPSIGLAFELQIIDRVPAEPTDRPVDYIVTENRLIDCRQRNMQCV
ncbi:MAG: 5-formyltetrahydrofolate cyclo-ligase [Firmicutes bacterium]|nr:5-formyltetrahydrofolate cyclo-ligase [Bacillota bacterium]MDD3298395.1 5-formyltetrahydrofolate cyclo-ligase [Bacillota bacterium]MDD3850704.1 5-formyltetrahydrofolate cyclo-ligase [Bacillota bacterium]